MWFQKVSGAVQDACECPTCGGEVQRRNFGEMYAGSFISDGQRVEIRRVPNDGYADPIFLDPITQYFDGGLYRLWPSEKYLSRGGKKLHRDVWAKAFGPIPAGCHIHHKDSNPKNNALANLECLPAHLHLSEAWHTNKHGRSEHFSELARERAADWHKSEEGRLWHSRHAIRAQSWTKWKREEKPCPQCSKLFNALVRNSGHSQIYCSPNCKAAASRQRRKAA